MNFTNTVFNVVTINNEADGNDGDGVDKERYVSERRRGRKEWKGGIQVAKGKCKI